VLIARIQWSADLPALARLAERIMPILQSNVDLNGRILAGASLINAYYWLGDLARQQQIVSIVLPLLDDAAAHPYQRATWCLHSFRYWCFGLADHERAIQTLKQGLQIEDENGCWLLSGYLSAFLFVAYVNAGDLAAATSLCQSIEARRGATQHTELLVYFQTKGLLALMQGDLISAKKQVLAALASDQGIGNARIQTIGHFLSAIVLIECKEYDEARAEISQFQTSLKPIPGRLHDYLSQLIEAYLTLAQGEFAQSDTLLRTALAIARDQSYVNHIHWYAPMMSRLCARALEAGIETEFVRFLIRKRNLLPESPDVENWPWRLKVQTLGKFELRVDDEPVIFSRKTPRKPIALLKAIIAFGGEDVTMQRLIDALWPELEGDAAKEAIDSALHRLRKLVGMPEAIQAHEGRLSLDSRHCWSDAWTFQQLLNTAEERWRKDADRDAIRVTEQAVQLYTGAFLATDAEEPWTVSMRERLRGKFIRLVSTHGRHLAETGRHGQAIDCYLRGLAADDLAEEFYQGLMRCYQQMGRTAEALAVYRRLRQTLSVTLGIAPSPASEALYRALQAG
jgi:DNA-binding SARP family transcriptional activator